MQREVPEIAFQKMAGNCLLSLEKRVKHVELVTRGGSAKVVCLLSGLFSKREEPGKGSLVLL